MKLVFIFFFVLLSYQMQAQTIRYVKQTASGTGTGLSWANASDNLQNMINASTVGNVVRVAAGTYKPTNKPFNLGVEITTTNANNKTFHVKDGVKIYGDFAGNETTFAARNIAVNITTLSGDFNSNDVVSGTGTTLFITGNTENAYYVVLTSRSMETASLKVMAAVFVLLMAPIHSQIMFFGVMKKGKVQ